MTNRELYDGTECQGVFEIAFHQPFVLGLCVQVEMTELELKHAKVLYVCVLHIFYYFRNGFLS